MLICLWLILPYLLTQLTLKTQLKSNLSDLRIQILSGNAFDSLIVTTLLHIMPQGVLDHVRKSSVIIHLKLRDYILGISDFTLNCINWIATLMHNYNSNASIWVVTLLVLFCFYFLNNCLTNERIGQGSSQVIWETYKKPT